MKPSFKYGLALLLSLFITFPATGRAEETIFEKEYIHTLLNKLADWQIENFTYETEGSHYFLHDYGINAWTNSVFYLGLSEWMGISDKKNSYTEWLEEIGTTCKWEMPANFLEGTTHKLYHADEICIGQFFLNMYEQTKEETKALPSINRIKWIINNPPDTSVYHRNKQTWTWCDALFMAPPVFARTARLTGEEIFLKFMHKEYQRTVNHLYDKEYKLFFRDDNYFERREANGEKVFWGRGNGWVAAGLANLLKQLPELYPERPYYENLFKELVERLSSLQDENGFWHTSLLDPESYPNPETSATTLIVYAIAYGINNGLLDRPTYFPVLEKGWKATCSAVNEEGKLGWVQPIGEDPKKVTADMTAVYGVGAFLLAGSEIYKLKE